MNTTTAQVEEERDPAVWGWLSAGNRALVLGASIGSFVHIHDAMASYGQAGFFAWLAAGVIELGGILGVLMLSQSAQIGGAFPAGVVVVAACQGISLWANQAMVTASAAALGGSMLNARISGVVFPAVVVLGLSLEIVMQRHHDGLARKVRDLEAKAVRERERVRIQVEEKRRAEAVRERAEAEAARARAEEERAQAAREAEATAAIRKAAVAPVARRATAPAQTVPSRVRTAPALQDAVNAARAAGVDTGRPGWYTGLAAEHGGSRTWWKDKVAAELAAQTTGVVRVMK